MTTNPIRVPNSSTPGSDRGPGVPSPLRPVPGTPKRGDPAGQPHPGDLLSVKSSSPSPVRPRSLALLLLALVLATSLAQGANEAIDDNDILEAIEADLRFDDAISADSVNVNVHAGVVRLSGTASSLLAKRRAVRLVASLKGVRAVVDNAEVRPSGRGDEQIHADVQAALRDDPVSADKEIIATVDAGRVTLKGTVESFPGIQFAEATVAGVWGGLIKTSTELRNSRLRFRVGSWWRLELRGTSAHVVR